MALSNVFRTTFRISDLSRILKFVTADKTSLPYFGVKLSCVCLMFADRKKIAYSYLKVT